MALNAQSAQLLEMIRLIGDPPITEQTPAEARARMRSRMPQPTQPIRDVTEIDIEGVPCRLYRPLDEDDLPLLIYFHGGGWVMGDLDTHENLCRSLSVRVGCLVLSVGYRLAPEHPFPAGLEDVVAVTRYAYEHAAALGADAARIAIGGDSAGGNLAAAVAQMAPAPVMFQLLFYPVTDARCVGRSYEENATGYLLEASSMRWFVDHYLSGTPGSPDDPRVSPLLAPDHALADQPPALVITAHFDPLRDEGEAYAHRLMDAGVHVTLTRYPGVFHGFVSMAELVDAGAEAIGEASAALRVAFST